MTAFDRVPVLLAVSFLAAFFAPTVAISADSDLVVAGAWIRQPPPGSDVAAVYLSLENEGSETVKLTGVESSVAAMAMMHQTVQSGGQSQMRMLASLSLAPGEAVAFSPGGRHIMLQGLTHPLQIGERVPLTLLFDGGIKLHILALVRPLNAN